MSAKWPNINKKKDQLPDAGKPLKATLPVAVLHVGCVIVPTVGAEGVAG